MGNQVDGLALNGTASRGLTSLGLGLLLAGAPLLLASPGKRQHG